MVQIHKKKSNPTMNKKAKSAAPGGRSEQDGKTKERYDFCAYATGLADGTSHIQVVKALGDYGSVNTFFPKHSTVRNKSENFCYVFFKEKESMLEAIATKHSINGAEVSMEESDKSAKKRSLDTKEPTIQPQKRFAGSPARTAYVGRLDPATLENTVLKYFVKYGEIEGVVVLGKPGNSKGFGFVTFKNMSDFEKALDDKHRIDNRDVIFRRKSTPNAVVEKPKHIHDNKNEVLVHLNTSITEEDFTSYFKQIGNVKSVTFPLDKKSAKPKGRGYAFVSFENTETFDDVLSTKHVINGIRIVVKSANKKQQTTEVKKESSNETKPAKETNTKQQYSNEVMIKNLPKSCNRKLLKTALSMFGNITNIALPRVVKDDMKSPIRGFAFISFQSESSMKKALEAFTIIVGGNKCQITQPKKNDAEQKKKVKEEAEDEEKMEVDEEEEENSDEEEENGDEAESDDEEEVEAESDDEAEADGTAVEADSDDEEEVEAESDEEVEADGTAVEADSDDEEEVETEDNEVEADSDEEGEEESDEEENEVEDEEVEDCDETQMESDEEEEEDESSEEEEVVVPVKKVQMTKKTTSLKKTKRSKK